MSTRKRPTPRKKASPPPPSNESDLPKIYQLNISGRELRIIGAAIGFMLAVRTQDMASGMAADSLFDINLGEMTHAEYEQFIRKLKAGVRSTHSDNEG